MMAATATAVAVVVAILVGEVGGEGSVVGGKVSGVVGGCVPCLTTNRRNCTDMYWNKFIAGSHRVLATAVDDWSENLFALAPVQAYAYVQ
jgi:hypothetical protein